MKTISAKQSITKASHAKASIILVLYGELFIVTCEIWQPILNINVPCLHACNPYPLTARF